MWRIPATQLEKTHSPRVLREMENARHPEAGWPSLRCCEGSPTRCSFVFLNPIRLCVGVRMCHSLKEQLSFYVGFLEMGLRSSNLVTSKFTS